jgi:hypothetical protein
MIQDISASKEDDQLKCIAQTAGTVVGTTAARWYARAAGVQIVVC